MKLCAASLLPHLAALPPFVASMQVSAQALLHGLVLTWDWHGPVNSLRIPKKDEVLDLDRLWAHTCFEVFLQSQGTDSYREFNFSPSGQHQCFDFDEYRTRSVKQAFQGRALSECCWHVGEEALCLRATLPHEFLPIGKGLLSVGLTAVLEDAAGQHSFWALSHHQDRPDFHDAKAWSLQLEL